MILSLRDPESWFSSTQETILQPFIMKMHIAMGTLDMCNKIGWGDDPKLRDKGYMLARFKQHNDDVLASVPRDKLLGLRGETGLGAAMRVSRCSCAGWALPSRECA